MDEYYRMHATGTIIIESVKVRAVYFGSGYYCTAVSGGVWYSGFHAVTLYIITGYSYIVCSD